MAKREALRDLQSRLASRMEAARGEGVRASWLGVESAGRRFLFPLSQSGEIFPMQGAHAVPYTQPWFLGVANLRGGLYGIVELAGLLGMIGSAPRSDAARSEARLVVLNPALEVNCAILIDRLAGLRQSDSFVQSEDPPSDAPAFYGGRYTEASGLQWQEIDLQALAHDGGFLSISAN